MLIKIKSYIKKSSQKIVDLQEVATKPSDYFINIADEKNIEKIKNDLDVEYLEGCLEIIYKNETIMGFDLWDLIDQLWSYFVELINNYLLCGLAESYFPDQPVKIILTKKHNNTILFSLKSDILKTWLLPEREFLHALLEDAEFFFAQIIFLLDIPNQSYMYELEKIKNIKFKLKNYNK